MEQIIDTAQGVLDPEFFSENALGFFGPQGADAAASGANPVAGVSIAAIAGAVNCEAGGVSRQNGQPQPQKNRQQAHPPNQAAHGG